MCVWPRHQMVFFRTGQQYHKFYARYLCTRRKIANRKHVRRDSRQPVRRRPDPSLKRQFSITIQSVSRISSLCFCVSRCLIFRPSARRQALFHSRLDGLYRRLASCPRFTRGRSRFGSVACQPALSCPLVNAITTASPRSGEHPRRATTSSFRSAAITSRPDTVPDRLIPHSQHGRSNSVSSPGLSEDR